MKNKPTDNLSIDRKAKYIDLILEQSEINRKLWNDYPERMMESAKRSAEMMLRRGLIKCGHENEVEFKNKIESGVVQKVRARLDEFEKRISDLESTQPYA